MYAWYEAEKLLNDERPFDIRVFEVHKYTL
jgi:hypothetical protein